MPRRFQFSLKWVFGLMFVASVVAAKAHYNRQAEIARVTAELKELKKWHAFIYSGRICGPPRMGREVDARTAEVEKRLETLRGH